ncbi:MAG: transporter substrate-binding domain-containing protein [Lachnospiraceae bacterium]|jgi:polar amino acid transport system substrate-binding protein|uniref:Transporter substrate-binding domain-containing protein n=1 Tax=Candidatus Scatomorpha intestinigallinarum TaxID=2840923 RepID=A0A9D1IZ99_9FIRM|nr:transporter substrate-binding domain-containing protein [Candidatus Scatomorpha intestinigallinarum]
MKKFFALLLALCMIFALAACGEPASEPSEAPASEAPASEAPASEEPAAESDMAYVQEKGSLIVGITEFEPMDYQNEAGEWIGFDADLARAFADSLGVEAVFQVIEWDNKVMELDGKTIDVVWNGMTLTDEVLSAMECSNAYCNNAQVVILPADSAEDYPDAASMSELNFAVESGSAGEAMAIENGFSYTPVVDQATAVLEVSSGTCQAAIIDSLMAAAMVGEGTSYADLTYTISLNSEEYGVGFRKGSDLAAALNEFFVDYYAAGTMQELAETYGVSAALIAQE